MNNNLYILGIPMDLGAGQRGVDMGPSAMRLAGLHEGIKQLGHTLVDYGNVNVPTAQSLSAQDFLHYAEHGKPVQSIENAHHAEAIATICKQAYQQLKELPANAFPIILGGDHAISIGSVAGVAHNSHRQAKGRTGVIWVDAHTDLNTPETSPSGNIHGMPLATLLGLGEPSLKDIWGGGAVVRPEDVVFIGSRSVDEGERALLRKHNIRAYTMRDVDSKGIHKIVEESLTYLESTANIHVSFDADALDPAIAPGVGTPVEGGLSYREAHTLMQLFSESERITSIDMLEVNPVLDEFNRTAKVMVDLLLTFLGQRLA